MNKQESQKRKLTKKMKLKLAGVFGIALLALVSLLVGITIINAKSGISIRSRCFLSLSSSIPIRHCPLKEAVLQTEMEPCWQIV